MSRLIWMRWKEGIVMQDLGIQKWILKVMEILELKGSGASKLLSNLVQADIIEPVSGHGKGKYKFKK